MTQRTARIVRVIETTLEVRGTGDEGSPLRRITQYWSLDGQLLAEADPVQTGRGELFTLVAGEERDVGSSRPYEQVAARADGLNIPDYAASRQQGVGLKA